MSESFFPLIGWLFDATFKGAVTIVLIAAVLTLVGRQLGARWRYAIWLLVIVRLALPVVPSSRWSIFNLLNIREAAPLQQTTTATVQMVTGRLGSAVVPEQLTIHHDTLSGTASVLLLCWMAGALFLLTRYAISSIRLQRSVRRSLRRQDPDARIAEIVAEAKVRLGIVRVVRLVVSDSAATPALHGIVHPTLILPAAVVQRFERKEIRHIVLHELWHLRRHDVAVNCLLAFLQSLHWFNPLVWFAVARIREEREICCDELALSCLEEDERSGYGTTILKLLEGFRTAAPVPAIVGIVNPKRKMKRRLMMIASFQNKNRLPLLALGLVVLAGGLAFTDARAGEKSVIKKMGVMECLAPGKLDQKISLDLNSASFGELLNAVANKSGSVVKQSPELATSSVQQARFTIHASNVPTHMLLMEALTPFGLSPKGEENGITIEKGGSCMMERHHGEMTEDVESHHDGNSERRVVKIVTGDKDGDGPDVVMSSSEPGKVEKRVMVRANAKGECKLDASGKLHRDVTLKIDEDGKTSEGRLQLDIDAPAGK